MRFRAYVLVLAALSTTLPAKAQESGGVASAALPRKPEAPHFIGAEQFFAESKVLGDAWSRAVGAVFDTMKRLAELGRITEGQVLRGPPPPIPWQVSAPGQREAAPTTRVVAFAPLRIEPVTEAAADTRGEHALLLGAQVTLPWMVP
jgi:hypothetical protein